MRETKNKAEKATVFELQTRDGRDYATSNEAEANRLVRTAGYKFKDKSPKPAAPADKA